MGLKHKVLINVENEDGKSERVLSGGIRSIPKWLVRLLFGKGADVIVLAPGKSVTGVEIKQQREEEVRDEQRAN